MAADRCLVDVIKEAWVSEGVSWVSESCSVMSDSLWPHGLYSPWNSPGQNTGVRSLPLHQGIFPTQGSNPDLPHCRWILYELNHKGSPGILEWVVYPFSRGSSRPRNWTRVSYRRILYQLSYQGSPGMNRRSWNKLTNWNYRFKVRVVSEKWEQEH